MPLWSLRDLLKATDVRFQYRLAVRFQDVDAAGVVFFARILEYVHDAYLAFLQDAGHDVPRLIAERKWLLPIRHLEVDYLQPLRYGDVVSVELVLAKAEDDEFHIGYRVRDERSGEIAAAVQSRHVRVDSQTFRRTSLPEELRALLASFTR